MIIAYSILPLVYFKIMRQLRKTLKEKTGDLCDKDTKYVLYQFYIFFISYLTRLVFFIPEVLDVTEVDF